MLDALETARQARPDPEPPLEPRRSAVAAGLGVLSVALLGAALVWAHHWGRWPTRLALRLAKIGLAGGIVSILALAVSGIAYAAGINPTGACGGG